jgi:integrase
MASIQVIKSPVTGATSYRVQVRVKGRPTLSKTFPNLRECKMWAAEIETAIRHGKSFPHLKAGRTSFVSIVERYRESAMGEVKTSTRDSRNDHLDWWNKKFAGLTLAEITPDKIAEARDDLAGGTYRRAKPRKDKQGNQVVPKEYRRTGATVNRYLATLSHLLSVAAKEWRLIDHNPVGDISKKKESRGRVRFLSDEERTKLLDACAASHWKPLYALVLLALSTGARRGELINLKWAAIDLKSEAARATVYDTKNGDPRVLPIVGKALETLRAMKLQGSARSEYVFPTPSGIPGPFEHFDSHWYDALEAAKVENFKFHDLRHSCASYLAAQGASLIEIADTLGHRTMSMVKRYAHLTQSHKVTAIEKMAKERGL